MFTITFINDCALHHSDSDHDQLKYSSYHRAIMQGILVSKLALGPFLTLSVRNGPNLQSYLFQEYISLNPRREEQNYTIYLKKWLKLYVETINVNFKLIIRCEN